MRSISLRAFLGLGAVLLVSATANAAFVFSTTRTPLTGAFAGDDGVSLLVTNNGTGGTGSDILFYDVTLAATNGTVNPRFYIRTWDGTIRNTANPSANTQADFGYQGFVGGDANRDGKVTPNDFSILAGNFNTPSGATWDIADFNGDGKVTPNDFSILAANFNSNVLPGSYVRFGSGAPAQFNSFYFLGFSPAENAQTFTDGQSVTGFEVSVLVTNGSVTGLPDTVATQLAYAVVPAGQGVTFSGTTGSSAGSQTPIPFTFTDAGSGLSAGFATAALVPEPASIGMLSVGALVLCRTRRQKRTA